MGFSPLVALQSIVVALAIAAIIGLFRFLWRWASWVKDEVTILTTDIDVAHAKIRYLESQLGVYDSPHLPDRRPKNRRARREKRRSRGSS